MKKTNMKNIFDVFIEIQKGSNMKYEYDKKLGRFRLDRVLYGTNVYPGDYGFIEKTLELDGDPVDVLVWISNPTFPGCVLKVKIIGGLGMIDDGEIDNKLIGICINDPEFNHINSLDEVSKNWKEKTYDFFQNYKNLENKQTILKNWLNRDEAVKIIKQCQERWIKKQKNS